MKSSQLCQVFLVPSGLIGPSYSSGWPVNGHIWLSVCRTDGRAAGVHWPPIYFGPFIVSLTAPGSLVDLTKYIYFLIVYLSPSGDLWASHLMAKGGWP